MSPSATRLAFESAKRRGVEVSVIWTAMIDGSSHHARGFVIKVADDFVLLDDEGGPLHLEAVEDVRHISLPPST